MNTINILIIILIVLALFVIGLAAWTVPVKVMIGLVMGAMFLAAVGWFIMKVSK